MKHRENYLSCVENDIFINILVVVYQNLSYYLIVSRFLLYDEPVKDMVLNEWMFINPE